MEHKKIVVGITGGIGSGKSFVANILRNSGFKVFDCDKEAKELMVSNQMVINDILNVVGKEAYIFNVGKDGNENVSLNKTLIADFLFRNSQNAHVINNIVHPRLAEYFREWTKLCEEDVVFMESAILFESGFDKLTDFTLLVYADTELRVRRCIDRDKSNNQDVLKRIKMQMDQGLLINMADFMVINNEGDELDSQLDEFLKFIRDNN